MPTTFTHFHDSKCVTRFHKPCTVGTLCKLRNNDLVVFNIYLAISFYNAVEFTGWIPDKETRHVS